MKIYIRKVLIFTVLFLLIYPFTLFIFEKVSPYFILSSSNLMYVDTSSDFMKNRIDDLKSHQNIDVLVVGSSHAYRGFDPRVFDENEISLFNLGSSSQSPLQTEVLLKRYYKDINPKVVIFEIYPELFCSDGVESSIGLLSSDKIDLRAFLMALRINNIRTYNTLFYSLVNRIFNKKSYHEHPLVIESHSYISGGYVERDQLYFYEGSEIESEEWEINKKQINAFRRCLNIISQNNAKVLLVYAPISTDLYKARTNNDEFIEKLESYGLPVYNFNNSDIFNDYKYFYDSHHLNQLGVNLFNNILIEQFKLKEYLKH